MSIDPASSATRFNESIRALAEYLYVMRGCQSGHDVSNWLEAEARMQNSLIDPQGSVDSTLGHFQQN